MPSGLPQLTLPTFRGWGVGGGHTSESQPKYPLLCRWCIQSLVWPRVQFLPQKLEGDTVNIFNARGLVQADTGDFWFPFSPLPLSRFLTLIPCSVFQMSVLLRTNQRLYFTNVTLSRLWGGCGDNEGLQRCETDRLKWIIRTESFCFANDTLQEIGSLSSI